MMLLHHDGDKREYAYGPKSKIGTFTDALMAQAMKNSWNVTSMKDDWKRIFAFDRGVLAQSGDRVRRTKWRKKSREIETRNR